VGVQWQFIVVLICIFSPTGWCYWTSFHALIHNSSISFYVVQLLPILKTGLSGSKSLIRYMFYKYFLPIYGFTFHLLNGVSQRAQVFNFDAIQLILLFLFWLALFVSRLRTLCLPPKSYIFCSWLEVLLSSLLHVCQWSNWG